MARGRIASLLDALVVLAALSPTATAVECRVESVGGTPTLVVDGRPHSGICYSSYDTSQANFGRRAREFSRAGCDLFNFVVEISGYGFSRPIWAGKDRWDFSDLDDRAHRVLEASPNAFLLPRIYLGADPFVVVDSKAEILATREDDSAKAVIARRRLGDWTSIYSAAAPLSAAFVKHLAAEAGVHIYDENPAHLLFANRHYLTIAADGAGGEALIRLPQAATVTDLSSGAVLCSEADAFSLELRPKEVRMVVVR